MIHESDTNTLATKEMYFLKDIVIFINTYIGQPDIFNKQFKGSLAYEMTKKLRNYRIKKYLVI